MRRFNLNRERQALSHNPMANCVLGERHEAQVPDTLDLADRMGLAVNALVNVWDPDERWSLALNVELSHRPAVLRTNHVTDAYLNVPPKFLEALVLSRLASGNEQNLDIDAAVLNSQLGLLGEDGLTYCPTDTLKLLSEPRPFAEIWAEGRSLSALSMLAQVDQDPRWIEIARRKVDRLLALTCEKNGFRFLWKGRFKPGERVPPDAREPAGSLQEGSLLDRYADPKLSVIYSVGSTGLGAGLLYRLTGYEPALELARGLTRWALARAFTQEDGRWNIHHFHHSLYALMAMCEYGVLAEDRQILERVDACFRCAREMGDPLIGFYPEFMPGSDRYLKREGNTAEICEIADMIWLALYLTRAGIGDYWEDVDRWVRNMYAEGQMLEAGFLDRLPDSFFSMDPLPSPDVESRDIAQFMAGDSRRGDKLPSPYLDTRDVAQRSVGSFWGWMRANDGMWVDQTDAGPKVHRGIMHCCTANGTRTLYHVWDSIVAKEADEVQVNLLLNRASPWLDVDSYLPAQGKVVLHIKDAPTVVLRMPEWCDLGKVTVTVGSQIRQFVANGRYIKLGWLERGDRVAVEFPVPERAVHRVIGEIPYTLTLRGSNVVSIDPRGLAYPLFDRQPTGSLVRKTRFITQIQQVVW